MQASVLIKLVPTWQGRQEALFALHTALTTHSCLPYLAGVVHGGQGCSSGDTVSTPQSSAPESLKENPIVLTSHMSRKDDGIEASAAQHAHLRTLEKIGTCMGWGRCGLCWWPIKGGIVKVKFDTSKPDDVLQLSSICRFAAAAFAANRANCRYVIRAACFKCGDTVVQVPDASLQLMKGVVQVLFLTRTTSLRKRHAQPLQNLVQVFLRHADTTPGCRSNSKWSVNDMPHTIFGHH